MRRDDCREFPSFVVLIVGILVASVVERVGTKEKGEEGEEGRGGREGVREDSSFYVLFRFVS